MTALEKGIDTFNKSTVALKNVFWFLAVIIACVFFYFKVDDHIKNEWLHRSYMKEIIQLQKQVNDLQWELKLLKQSVKP